MESPVQSSEITGEGEGCSSIESGWTMYLASPMNDHDIDVFDEDDADHGDGEVYYSLVSDSFHDSNSFQTREAEDDSLASDASTGNIEKPASNIEKHHDFVDDDGDDYYGYDHGYSSKFSSNVKKKVAKKEKKEKKGSCFMSLFKGGDSSSGTSTKIWKTNFTGK